MAPEPVRVDAVSGSSVFEGIVESSTRPPLAYCECRKWAWYEVPAIGGLGWHGLPLKCPKCQKWYLIVIRVRLRSGELKVEVCARRRIMLHGEAGIRRALLAPPIPGMNEDDVEFIATVARLLVSGSGDGRSPQGG